MARVATYVFIDLETTGLPAEELNKTKITELSMVAVKRNHILDTKPGSVPRVQHKLTLCFNPRRFISEDGTKVTGLCNYLLEDEPVFSLDVFNMINTFLNILSKPVCLIAQNGLGFDYPILKNHLEKLEVSFSNDLLCADCYHGFYDILEKNKQELEANFEKSKVHAHIVPLQSPANGISSNKANDIDKSKESPTKSDVKPCDDVDFYTDNSKMQAINETTPKSKKVEFKVKHSSKARRRMPWGSGPKPEDSYKLKDIYERVLNRPASDAHRAENDCVFALEVSTALAKQFVKWVDENYVEFSEVKPMTIGVPLGLLTLTGVLWGCTNPFIKQGTKGLRDVKAKGLAGQTWAEISFLLGNWRYVVPWLVNQCGSLVYLLGVQRAPLSLAVPAANGLAFVCSALTAAATGLEEPLQRGSILGIALIVAGTAICCLDKTS